MTGMDEKLKLCPFCGSATKPTVFDFDGEPYVPGFEVRCDASGWDGDPTKGCGATSGWGETREEAISAWNRRVSAHALEARYLEALLPTSQPSALDVPAHPEGVKDETAWLIELRGSRPTWWSLHPDEEPGWATDANKALRFARQEDAEAYINDIGWTEAFTTEHMWCGARRHPDDAAVDRFAVALKDKLAKKRAEGRGGWDRKDECTAEFLSSLLREHVEKGDPVDVGNLAMMLHQRGERIS